MTEAILLLVGVVIGIFVKAIIDPILSRRDRGDERREKWLEDAVNHAEAVLACRGGAGAYSR